MVCASASVILPCSCTIKSRGGFLLEPAYPGCPRKRAVKWLCVCSDTKTVLCSCIHWECIFGWFQVNYSSVPLNKGELFRITLTVICYFQYRCNSWYCYLFFSVVAGRTLITCRHQVLMTCLCSGELSADGTWLSLRWSPVHTICLFCVHMFAVFSALTSRWVESLDIQCIAANNVRRWYLHMAKLLFSVPVLIDSVITGI